MIVDFNNDSSMKYAEVAVDSFNPMIQRGIISEIVLTQGVTPDTLHLVKHDYDWHRSLATIDGARNYMGRVVDAQSGNVIYRDVWDVFALGDATKAET